MTLKDCLSLINVCDGEPTHHHPHTHKLEQYETHAEFCSTPNFYSHSHLWKWHILKCTKPRHWTSSDFWASLDIKTNTSFAALPHLCCSPLTPCLCVLPCFWFQVRMPSLQKQIPPTPWTPGLLQPSGCQVWISAHHLGIYHTVTLLELLLVNFGINEWWIMHLSCVLFALPIPVGSYLGKRTMDWHFFSLFSTGREIRHDLTPSDP